MRSCGGGGWLWRSRQWTQPSTRHPTPPRPLACLPPMPASASRALPCAHVFAERWRAGSVVGCDGNAERLRGATGALLPRSGAGLTPCALLCGAQGWAHQPRMAMSAPDRLARLVASGTIPEGAAAAAAAMAGHGAASGGHGGAMDGLHHFRRVETPVKARAAAAAAGRLGGNTGPGGAGKEVGSGSSQGSARGQAWQESQRPRDLSPVPMQRGAGAGEQPGSSGRYGRQHSAAGSAQPQPAAQQEAYLIAAADRSAAKRSTLKIAPRGGAGVGAGMLGGAVLGNGALRGAMAAETAPLGEIASPPRKRGVALLTMRKA